ncbi:MAG: triose-phosphate isomerase [Oscillospiraceae bacterium]
MISRRPRRSASLRRLHERGQCAELLAQPDIDGGLIGGASLKPVDFSKIVAATAQGACE